ncbi:MAG TPA: hypothetical protein VEA41_22630 [Salinarimonas sp.]|nr:hypothetical protein [Salinarimonas sp.]
MDADTARKIASAYNDGVAEGRALRVGSRFLGALEAARDVGYTDGDAAQLAFIAGYIDGIGANVEVDGNGEILAFHMRM